jgi:hypothetical protein
LTAAAGSRDRRRVQRPIALVLGLVAACGGGGTATFDAAVSDVADASVPAPDAAPDAMPTYALDVFGTPGNTYTFTISPQQASTMDQWVYPEFYWSGDEYGAVAGAVATDDAVAEGETFADDLTVTLPNGLSRSYGQIETWLIGQSSMRDFQHIPNLRINSDSFAPGLTIGGFENLRFNNGQVGSLYREALAFDVWDALGYPTPLHAFAWVEAPNQWPGTRVPYTIVEVYKRSWCERHFPDGCLNMWEGVGEPWYQWYREDPETCQFDTCDSTRLAELETAMSTVAPGDANFEEALSDFIDWDAYRDFLCLGWITDTGDDAVHNTNNVVVVEAMDHTLHFMPYSIDISSNQSWWHHTPLMGRSALSIGCNRDPECRAALVERCDELLTELETQDIAGTVVEPLLAQVEDLGMMRADDETTASRLRDFWANRAQVLRDGGELDLQVCSTDSDCAGEPGGATQCRLRVNGDWGQPRGYDTACEPPLVDCTATFSCDGGYECRGGDPNWSRYLCYPPLPPPPQF